MNNQGKEPKKEKLGGGQTSKLIEEGVITALLMAENLPRPEMAQSCQESRNNLLGTGQLELVGRLGAQRETGTERGREQRATAGMRPGRQSVHVRTQVRQS